MPAMFLLLSLYGTMQRGEEGRDVDNRAEAERLVRVEVQPDREALLR